MKCYDLKKRSHEFERKGDMGGVGGRGDVMTIS